MPKTYIVAAGIAAIALSGAAVEARSIRAVGSSTVYPFTTAVAEQFKRQYPQFGAPIIESTGTGAGMKLFCAGIGIAHPDIENASRRIKASELKQCRANGVTQVVEVQIGLDGVVFAHAGRARNFALSTVDVYKALAATPYGRPNTARTWKDVNPGLPATKIEVMGPPPTSGTRDALAELILTTACEKNPAMAALKKSDENRFKTVCTKVREDGAYVEAGENDNLIVQKLASNPNAIGVFGWSFLEENMDKVKSVPIGGVTPTYASISNYSYPGARPLYIYVKAQHARAVRGLKEFVAMYAQESTWGKNGYLAKRGLVAAPEAVRARAAQNARTMAPLNPATIK